MKTTIKITALLVLLAGYATIVPAQEDTNKTAKRILAKVDPYAMCVTYNKTSHLIFSAPIRYVDLGSDYLMASKAEGAGNVLRVKATVADFQEETNFSVITEDGRFYTFDVYYSPYPVAMSYDLTPKFQAEKSISENNVQFDELGSDAPYLTKLILEGIHRKNEKAIKHIGSRSYDIRFLLKGIYIHNGKFYFHTELRNMSNVPFNIYYVNFKIVDRKLARRKVIQERVIAPLSSYQFLDKVEGNDRKRNVFLLDQFTITDDRLLIIEIFEKNGGRHQKLEIENTDLVGAKMISDIDLNIK